MFLFYNYKMESVLCVLNSSEVFSSQKCLKFYKEVLANLVI